MTKDVKFLIETVKQASKLVTDKFDVSRKADSIGSFVTEIDIAVEKFLVEKIKKAYPDFEIISEELNSEVEVTDNCFIIDPIDGTTNFSNKIPLWVIQVAMRKNGKIVAAVLYAPKLHELYYADENGAFLNDEKIFVHNNKIDVTLFSGNMKNAPLTDTKLLKYTRHTRHFRSTGIDFAWVAAGRLGGAYYKYDSIWDYIAGQYLVEKAGGVIHNEPNFHAVANNEETMEILKREVNGSE